MYGRQSSSISIAVGFFLAGWLFATFFSVIPRDGSLIRPAQTQPRG